MDSTSTSDARFSVGQIIFVFMKDKSKLLPARIVEETLKRTIDGERVSYSIQFSTQEPNAGFVNLDSLKDEVFATAEDARRVLSERTVASIKRLVDVAVQRAGELFPENLDELTRPAEEMKPTIAPAIEIAMPDGTRAKIRVKK